MVEIKILSADDCPLALFRFRYAVYVEEMGRKQRYAQHDSRTIVDPLDDTGVNVVAFDSDEIIGCVRINLLRDGDVGDYALFYGLDALNPGDVDAASICTRLMMKRTKRRTVATIGVMSSVYEFALRRGINTNYIDCNRHLIGFFSKFGYVELASKDHPEYGNVTLMRLDLRDRERLQALNSPFAPILENVLAEELSGDRRIVSLR